MGTRMGEDLFVAGNINSRTLTIPAGSVLNAGVGAAAAIAATKLIQQHIKHVSQESGTAVPDEEFCIHVVYGATGTAVAFEAGAVVVSVGAATVSVDLHKNGTTILSSAITLNSNQTAYETVTATIGTNSLVDGDVLEVLINGTVGGGTLAKGVFASLVLRELPE